MASADVAIPIAGNAKKPEKAARIRKVFDTKESKSEKKKEPKAPSAYQLFFKAKSAEIKAKDPSVANKDVMKLVAEMWKTAPENMNRGQPPKKRAKKADAESKPKAAEKKEVDEADEHNDHKDAEDQEAEDQQEE